MYEIENLGKKNILSIKEIFLLIEKILFLSIKEVPFPTLGQLRGTPPVFEGMGVI